jgi:histone H1/5
MELIVIVAVVAVGLIWYFTASNSKSVEAASAPEAPYKAETPTLTEMAAKAEVVAVKKAPAVKAKAPAVKAKAPAAKIKAAAKAPVKKPVAKKPVPSKKSV